MPAHVTPTACAAGTASSTGSPDADGGSMLDTGILVARHEIEYLKPLKWRPEPVHIDLWITTLKGAMIEVGYEVYDQPEVGERVRYALAESTLVIYDLVAERPKRLSEADIARLDGLRGEPVPFKARRRKSA